MGRALPRVCHIQYSVSISSRGDAPRRRVHAVAVVELLREPLLRGSAQRQRAHGPIFHLQPQLATQQAGGGANASSVIGYC